MLGMWSLKQYHIQVMMVIVEVRSGSKCDHGMWMIHRLNSVVLALQAFSMLSDVVVIVATWVYLYHSVRLQRWQRHSQTLSWLLFKDGMQSMLVCQHLGMLLKSYYRDPLLHVCPLLTHINIESDTVTCSAIILTNLIVCVLGTQLQVNSVYLVCSTHPVNT